MSAIHTLLDELQKRVKIAENQITDFDSKKNELTEIENLLLKYEIHNRELTNKDLLSLEIEDLKKILELTNPKHAEEVLPAVLTNIQIMRIYIDAEEKFDQAFDGKIYKDASKVINKQLNIINKYVRDFAIRNREYIESLKESIKLPKEYLDMFNGEQLKEPIIDIDSLINLLNTLNFKPIERAEIMKYIAVSNYELLIPKQEIKEDKIAKYRVIVSNKQEKYEEVHKLILEEDLATDDLETLTELLSEKYHKEYNEVQQAVVIELLIKHIEEYDDTILKDDIDEKFKEEYLNSIINEMENVLTFSRKEHVAEVVKEEPKVLTEDEKFIISVKEILEKEKDVIALTNEKDYNMNLVNSINDKDAKSLIFELASVLTALQAEVMRYEQLSKGTFADENMLGTSLGNIREFLKAYDILKRKQEEIVIPEEPKEEPKEINNKTIFLTDANNESFIFHELDGVEQIYLDQVKSLLEYNIYQNNLTKIKPMDVGRDIKTFRLTKKDVRLAFMKGPNDTNIVLTVSIKSDSTKQKVQAIYDQYKDKINELLKQIDDPKELQMIFDEQANIRAKLSDQLTKVK